MVILFAFPSWTEFQILWVHLLKVLGSDRDRTSSAWFAGGSARLLALEMHGCPTPVQFSRFGAALFGWALLIVHIGISLTLPQVKGYLSQGHWAWDSSRQGTRKPLGRKELQALALPAGLPADAGSWSQLLEFSFSVGHFLWYLTRSFICIMASVSV